MNIYKVVFTGNEIASCRMVTDSASSYCSYHFEHDKGKLVYALIKDETETNARSVALSIIKEVSAGTGRFASGI